MVRRVQPIYLKFHLDKVRSFVRFHSKVFLLLCFFEKSVALFPRLNCGESEEQTNWAKQQLQLKFAALGRLPQKADFDAVTLSRIKAFLGPWPRALEAAGLKNRKTN